MGHAITSKDSLFYAGETPWHKIGKKVDGVLTASEALLASGLTWKVEQNKIFDQAGAEIQGYRSIIREDTKEVFQITSDKYRPVQNDECFRIFDECVGTGMAKYEVAGSLQGGRKVWILAKLPYDFEVLKQDEVKSYLLLTTSHDGSLAFQMFQTPVRVVCMNTLRASLQTRQNGKVAYFKHTTHFKNRVGQAQIILAQSKAYFDRFKEQSQELARKQMTNLEIDSFLHRLFDVEGKEEISPRTKGMIEDVQKLVNVGIGADIPGVRGTGWGVFNAVTEYIDHERATRGEEENRFVSAQYGSGADLRDKAFNLLLS
jgi:phage/plasmid-like protein (TIGR03299 family)